MISGISHYNVNSCAGDELGVVQKTLNGLYNIFISFLGLFGANFIADTPVIVQAGAAAIAQPWSGV